MAVTTEASHILTFLLAEKSVRGVILDGTTLVQEMRTRHGLGPLETLVLGQALQVTALMASSLKGHDEIGLRIDCAGPIKGIVAEATATGEVRGYLKQVPIPQTDPLQPFDERDDLNPFWEDGFLTITRYLEEGRQPFSGSVALQPGNIASEVARYYLLSEQIPTAIHLSLVFDIHDRVTGAGGLLLQAMPGASDKFFASLAQKTQTLPSLGKALTEGRKVDSWLNEQFSAFSPDILEEHSVHFHCRCDAERMRLLLLHLPLADLEEIRNNGPFPVQLTCHYCSKAYLFDQKALADICQEKQSCT
ncbi:MAG: Hsp33 family molecular chaperone HslO [Desulfocapsaceae bacterium]|nr:Hsp33 family molecular chaperone HslO [Desulfocapsaceae bacterium]